jgi:hypothetical protein
MKPLSAAMLLCAGLLSGCGGAIDTSIDLMTISGSIDLRPQFAMRLKPGGVDRLQGAELTYSIQPPEGAPATGTVDQSQMVPGNDGGLRYLGPAAAPGSLIEGTWTARFQGLAGGTPQPVVQTSRAHVGYDIRLLGLALVDAGGRPLPVYADGGELAGCRIAPSGAAFGAVVLVGNASYSPVPRAMLRVVATPTQQVTSDPTELSGAVDLPAQLPSTGVSIGPFYPQLRPGNRQAVLHLRAFLVGNDADFDQASDTITYEPGASDNPACRTPAGGLDREACQVCLIVADG